MPLVNIYVCVVSGTGSEVNTVYCVISWSILWLLVTEKSSWIIAVCCISANLSWLSILVYTQVISVLYQAIPSILSKYTRWPCCRVDMYHFIIFWLTFDTFNLVEISFIMHLSLLQNAPYELYYQVSNSWLWRRCF